MLVRLLAFCSKSSERNRGILGLFIASSRLDGLCILAASSLGYYKLIQGGRQPAVDRLKCC